jgi:phosphodiesterase/alkaline phosphatase D-like protein
MTLTRRRFLARSGALAGALALPAATAFGSGNARRAAYATWKTFPRRV